MKNGLSKGARFIRCCRQSGKLRWLHPWRCVIGGMFKFPVGVVVLVMICISWLGERLARLDADAKYLADTWWNWYLGPDPSRETKLRIRAWRSRPAAKEAAR